MQQLQQAMKLYSFMTIEQLEISLIYWFDPSWMLSPYRDIFIPYIINYKLNLNELEYDI